MTTNSPAPRHLIAPCGLDCSRCVGCSEGSIAIHAKVISETLGNNFKNYADRLKTFNPAMKYYREFRELLDSLCTPSCGGCRSESRDCLPVCNVADCVAEKNIEFCFQCDDYPECDRTGMPEILIKRWRANNDYMKEHGIENFINMLTEIPRYP